MFIHNFKYALKTLFKNKMLIFWTFAFPIILGTFFNMAFSNIEKSEQLDVIDIAIVNNDYFETNMMYKDTFKKLSDTENKDRLFNVKLVKNEKKAKKLLDKDKVVGYLLLVDQEPKIVVKKSGVDETIFKYVVEEISGNEKILINVGKKKINEIEEKAKLEGIEIGNYDAWYREIYTNVLKKMQEKDDNIKDISSSKLSYTMIEFYTLIAMACLTGGLLGMSAINQNLANMSSNGKRVAVSPAKKRTLVLSSALASYVTQVFGIAILFLYTVFVLKVDYGSNLPLIILLSLAGCLAGLSLGILVACIFKTNDNTKTGIVISITMLGCFLSGMMGITMKYIIDKNVPIINKINPANMITDGFYSLYYYDTLNRFYFNVVSLLIFAFVLIGISMFSLRRQKYDSI